MPRKLGCIWSRNILRLINGAVRRIICHRKPYNANCDLYYASDSPNNYYCRAMPNFSSYWQIVSLKISDVLVTEKHCEPPHRYDWPMVLFDDAEDQVSTGWLESRYGLLILQEERHHCWSWFEREQVIKKHCELVRPVGGAGPS